MKRHGFKIFTSLLLLMLSLPLQLCSSTSSDHITIQHILIGFRGSIPGKNITRTQEEAENLAKEIYTRAYEDEDFGSLVEQYTDDSAPGIYRMSNTGITPNPGEYPRNQMVQGFGDVSFSLNVDEVGMAEYHPQTSPYGWHIIKRIQ